MYKIASQNLQHAARPNKVPTFARGDDFEIKPEDERNSLKSRLKQVEAELLELPRGDKRRIELGVLKNELQNRMNAIRPKKRGPPNLQEFFIEVAREILPRHTYKLLMDESVLRAKKAEMETE